MVRIILHGCSGRMGHIITEICAEDDQVQIVAGVDAFGDAYADYPVFRKPEECPEADVVIDFSTAAAMDSLLTYCAGKKLPVIVCIFNNAYLGMVRQWQKLFYGQRYSMTDLRAGALTRRTHGKEHPAYTPDFVKLAESYGAYGLRVTKKEEISAAFEKARSHIGTPTLIEFIIDPEEMVYPMIKPGGTLADMILNS